MHRQTGHKLRPKLKTIRAGAQSLLVILRLAANFFTQLGIYCCPFAASGKYQFLQDA
jgi:hypothetical protein